MKKQEEKYLTFCDINQARVSLKMLLSNYSWFNGIVIVNKHGWMLEVNVNSSDPKVKALIPQFHKDVPTHINMLSDK